MRCSNSRAVRLRMNQSYRNRLLVLELDDEKKNVKKKLDCLYLTTKMKINLKTYKTSHRIRTNTAGSATPYL